MPKVSVVVPVYNVEKYLASCLRSILAQTHQDIELICVNDGSTDGSADILEQFSLKDKRVEVITQTNQGISIARNIGLKKATGEFCMFIDSDDAIHPQTVEICLSFANMYQADLVCFGFQRTDGSSLENISSIDFNQIKSKQTDNPLRLALSSRRFRIPFSASTKFYRTDTIRDIPFVEHIYYEDGPHTYALLSKHPKTVVLDQKFYFYTQNMSSVSNLKSNMKQLLDYRTVMLYINDVYQNSVYPHDILFIRRFLFPKYLRNQLKCCRKAEPQNRLSMLQAFGQSLRLYKSKKMLNARGCGVFKYLKYLWIMYKY